MSKDKETRDTEQATREFFEGLSVDKLRVLLKSPLAPTVMEHCAESETLSLMVQEIFDDEFNQMSAEEQERWERPVVTPESLEAEEGSKEPDVPQSFPIPMSSGYSLPLAAASSNGGGADAQLDRRKELLRFASVILEGTTFTFEEDPSSGTVFIAGQVPGDATHLYLADDAYELRRTTARNRFELVGAGLIRVERFLSQHEQNPETHPIRFGRTK